MCVRRCKYVSPCAPVAVDEAMLDVGDGDGDGGGKIVAVMANSVKDTEIRVSNLCGLSGVS